MKILAIDGREYKQLHLVGYDPEILLLDGEGTGRSKAPGWNLIRDPQGYIINFSIKVPPTSSENPDFVHLIRTGKKLGSQSFVKVGFLDMIGDFVSQDMYFQIRQIPIKRIDSRGVTHTNEFSINFIAKKGIT